MAAIAKFISFDGGIAFSDSVVKFQKRNGDAKLFPLGEIDSVSVRKPQQENRGFIRLQTRDRKLYRVFFDEEQYSQALVFKKQLDEQLSAGAAPAPAPEPEPEPEPEPVREEPVSEQPDSGSLPEERPERRPSRRQRATAGEYDEDTEEAEEEPEEEDDGGYDESPSLLRKWWLWLIIVLLVVAIAAAVLLIVRKLKADDAAPSAPVNTSVISIPAPIDEPEAPGAAP